MNIILRNTCHRTCSRAQLVYQNGIKRANHLWHSSTPSLAQAKAQLKPSPANAAGAVPTSIIGESLSHTLDLGEAYIGQQIEIPYESTVNESEQCMWLSTFQHHDRIYTSTPYAQSLNLQSHLLPFSMMLFRTISMAHVDESREVLDLGYDNAVYIRPVYAGNTLRQSFVIKHLRHTKDGKNTVVTVGCELVNQRNLPVFSVDKTMLYPMLAHPFRLSRASSTILDSPNSHLLSHILYNGDGLTRSSSAALVHPQQLVLHNVARPIGIGSNMALSTLFRWTHPSIYNKKRFHEDDLLVPGGLVLAATLAATSRGFFECLHETVTHSALINKASPSDMIGALSYVHSIKPLKEGFEELEVTTIGAKNIDIAVELANVPVPVELFSQSRKSRSDIEELASKHCPKLKDSIVCIAHRRIVRQSPFSRHIQMPLL